MELISIIQKQIESIYGIKVGTSAQDYLIDNHELLQLLPAHQQTYIPKELFLVNPNPQNDTVEVALFFDSSLKQNLCTNNPLNGLDHDNISDFCTLIEGVSHFVYYLHKASLDCEITQLELELQAEIDKFLLLALLTTGNENIGTLQILDLLFDGYGLNEGMTEDQIIRYKTASFLARKFCFELSQQIKKNTVNEAIKEARLFYVLSQEEKIRRIVS